MKYGLLILCALGAAAVSAQDKRGDFLRQQAFAEMQRVTGQVDVLQNNFDELQRRVQRLEGGNATQSLRAEIDALKASVAELKRALANQRGEIVKDLSGRIAKMQPPPEKPSPRPKAPSYTGPCDEYVVQGGDTLSLISMAFKTTVPRLREMNNLKNDNLRVGQKLLVPRIKE